MRGQDHDRAEAVFDLVYEEGNFPSGGPSLLVLEASRRMLLYDVADPSTSAMGMFIRLPDVGRYGGY